MNYFEHFYPYVEDLLCCEEEADAIMKTADAINSLNPSKQSEAEMVMFIQDQFDNLLYGTGHEYNYPGYNAVYQLMKSLKNLDLRLMNYNLYASMQSRYSTGIPGVNP